MSDKELNLIYIGLTIILLNQLWIAIALSSIKKRLDNEQ